MKFRVSSKVKGVLTLVTIKRSVKANSTVFVGGDDIYAPDIQGAIRTGLLLPLDEEGEQTKTKLMEKGAQVVIINKTNRVLILGKGLAIKPNGSILKERRELDFDVIKKAEERGIISIIAEDGNIIRDDVIMTDISPKNKTTKKKEDILNKKDDSPVNNPMVWDFREQEAVEPVKVPKTVERPFVKTNEEEPVNNKDSSEITNKIDKIAQKFNVSKKKKGKHSNTKKIEPVGEVYVEKTSIDAEGVLDERGNIIKKPSNTLVSMIDGVETPDISFADVEQEKQLLKERQERNSNKQPERGSK